MVCAETLSFYHTVKRLGIPDSQIILMMAEAHVAKLFVSLCRMCPAMHGTADQAQSSTRSLSLRAQEAPELFLRHHKLNLYGTEVEAGKSLELLMLCQVDYRGDEVSVENFLRLLTGLH